jgi:L-fuconolactonase
LIVDAHCHVWERWPYEPPVPDPDGRARAEQLLFEMDQNGVETAVLIAARLGGNPGNNDYVVATAAAHPGRFVPFVDVDSRWNDTYRTDGAAQRLADAADRWGLVGFTHYLAEDDDAGWLVSDEGRRFFGVAEARGLVASLSVLPAQVPVVATVAAAFPRLTILLHHMGFLGPRTETTPGGVRHLIDAAAQPNIHVKVSGFGNVAAPTMDYPYPGLAWIVRLLHETYGPWRLHWGSDYPVSRRHMTYRQTLDALRRHGGLPEASVETILGPSFRRLLAARGHRP